MSPKLNLGEGTLEDSMYERKKLFVAKGLHEKRTNEIKAS
jgi:hypothetical protein